MQAMGKEHVMKLEQPERDRRRSVRVNARGRVEIHGGGYGRGQILDLSASGVRFRLASPIAAYRPDDRIDLEMRFDGVKGGWWRMVGRIVRVDVRNQLVVAFENVPTGFERWIATELVAAQATDVACFDQLAQRRGRVAIDPRIACDLVRPMAVAQ
jgi:hypothetical protein